VAALVLFALCSASCSAYRSIDVYTVPLSQLQEPTTEVRENVFEAISKVGLFMVSLGEDESQGFQETLDGFAACLSADGTDGVIEGDMDGAVRRVVLDDGTEKYSVASATNHSVPQSYPEALLARPQCSQFVSASRGFRDTVDRTGRAFSSVLDELTDSPSAHDQGDFDSFSNTVSEAESLEHFHLFTRPRINWDNSQPTLHMHSDVGMFIIMTPAKYFHLSQLKAHESGFNSPGVHGGGFYLELPDGEIVSPRFGSNRDKQKTLVVMGGEGARNWIRRPQKVPVYAPGHEVVLPDLDALARVWYGRMYFPARQAKLLDTSSTGGKPQTFGNFLTQSYNAFKDGRPEAALALGCHPNRRALADESSCSGDQIYCWMSCQPVVREEGDDCPKEEALCRDRAGRLWPQDYTTAEGTIQHCFDCVAKCPARPDPPPSPNGTVPNGTRPEAAHHGFCNRQFQATVMWMTGFQTASDGSQPCVALLFEAWVLDSQLKFALGCLGTAAVGVLVEWIVHSRRKLQAALGTRLDTRAKQAAYKATMLGIYATQVFLGYMLMLVAMTYEAELFMMVVVGLSLGHGLFNLHAPVLDSAEACCMGHDASTASIRGLLRAGDSSLSLKLLTSNGTASSRDLNCCPCPVPMGGGSLEGGAGAGAASHRTENGGSRLGMGAADMDIAEVEETHVVVVGEAEGAKPNAMPGCCCD